MTALYPAVLHIYVHRQPRVDPADVRVFAWPGMQVSELSCKGVTETLVVTVATGVANLLCVTALPGVLCQTSTALQPVSILGSFMHHV